MTSHATRFRRVRHTLGPHSGLSSMRLVLKRKLGVELNP
jgi:hypothetical protein